jgi:hypothetical protein
MSDKSETAANRRLSSEADQELIRQRSVAEFHSLCARVAEEAKARGLTESVLNELLQD